MLVGISAIDETWLRAYHPKLKRQSSEWRHTGITQGLTKSLIHEADDQFDIRPARYFYVSSRCTGSSLWAHSMISCFRSTTYVVQLGRRPQNCLKMPSSCMLMLQPTQHALKDVLRRSGWQVLQHPPYSHYLSPCDCSTATRCIRLLTALLTGFQIVALAVTGPR